MLTDWLSREPAKVCHLGSQIPLYAGVPNQHWSAACLSPRVHPSLATLVSDIDSHLLRCRFGRVMELQQKVDTNLESRFNFHGVRDASDGVALLHELSRRLKADPYLDSEGLGPHSHAVLMAGTEVLEEGLEEPGV